MCNNNVYLCVCFRDVTLLCHVYMQLMVSLSHTQCPQQLSHRDSLTDSPCHHSSLGECGLRQSHLASTPVTTTQLLHCAASQQRRQQWQWVDSSQLVCVDRKRSSQQAASFPQQSLLQINNRTFEENVFRTRQVSVWKGTELDSDSEFVTKFSDRWFSDLVLNFRLFVWAYNKLHAEQRPSLLGTEDVHVKPQSNRGRAIIQQRQPTPSNTSSCCVTTILPFSQQWNFLVKITHTPALFCQSSDIRRRPNSAGLSNKLIITKPFTGPVTHNESL